MSAQDHLSPQQFYHGSPHQFKPGDLVEPGHPRQHIRTHGATGDYVYAATDSEHGNGDITAGFFGSHTYEVEPTGRMTHDPEDKWGMGMYRSKSPLKVIREIQE